jgi:hypothetical protein
MENTNTVVTKAGLLAALTRSGPLRLALLLAIPCVAAKPVWTLTWGMRSTLAVEPALWTSNRLSQFQQRRNVINELMPMQFNTKLCDTRVFGGRGKLCPVGQQFLVPLPLENLAVLQRPCARDPIWSNVRRPPRGQTGH